MLYNIIMSLTVPHYTYRVSGGVTGGITGSTGSVTYQVSRSNKTVTITSPGGTGFGSAITATINFPSLNPIDAPTTPKQFPLQVMADDGINFYSSTGYVYIYPTGKVIIGASVDTAVLPGVPVNFSYSQATPIGWASFTAIYDIGI